MLRAKTIHELRQEVKANDKFFAAAKPEAEAIARLVENYQTTEDCARAFVAWLKGDVAAESPKAKPPGSVLETWHRQGDVEEGKERLLSDDESAKARKPRRRK